MMSIRKDVDQYAQIALKALPLTDRTFITTYCDNLAYNFSYTLGYSLAIPYAQTSAFGCDTLGYSNVSWLSLE